MMNYEAFVFDFLESVVTLAGGVFQGKRLEMGEGGLDVFAEVGHFGKG